MDRETDDLLKLALKLPPEARAALAGSLIDSLDEAVDERAFATTSPATIGARTYLKQGRRRDA